MKGKTPRTKSVQEPPPGYNESAIVIYETADGVRLDVKLERETLWLTQKQIAALFETERSVITKHLRNIFKSGELIQDSVCANFAQTAADGKTYGTAFYNLDAVISVGYRVNSKRGTQFRIWATSVLRDHLLKGYSLNERRLRELNRTIRLIADVTGRRELSGDDAKALLSVVTDYSFALDLLDDYDHQRASPQVRQVPKLPVCHPLQRQPAHFWDLERGNPYLITSFPTPDSVIGYPRPRLRRRQIRRKPATSSETISNIKEISGYAEGGQNP